MNRSLCALTVALLALGGLGYADWVMQLALPVHADLTSSFISELSSPGQPYHELFRWADLAAGALLGVGVVLAWAQTRRFAAVWTPLLLLAVCTVFEAASPLADPYTFGDDMPDPGTGAWWAKVSEPHGISSLLETIAFLVVLGTCALALRAVRADATRRRTLLLVGVTAAVCGAIDAVLTASLLLNGNSIGLGLVQRAGVTLTAIWLATAPAWLFLRLLDCGWFSGPRVREDAAAGRRS